MHPDVIELIWATKDLLANGFTLSHYCNDAYDSCRKLADAGAVAKARDLRRLAAAMRSAVEAG
jgi:thiazole synthase ThiGH ThiG subunit